MATRTSDGKIGTYHLADDKSGLYEVQRSNNYELVIAFGDTTLSYAGEDAGKLSINGARATEVLRLSVTKASVPHFEQDVIEISRGNSIFKAAGKPKFSSGTIVFNDYIGADTVAILEAWQGRSYDVINETVGQMQDYKFDATLIEYTPDYKISRNWDLKGCWISKLDEEDFDSDNGGKRQVTATIEYDRAIPRKK